jgi:RNA polymerase sigma-70 factor, ECF subfamily
MSNVALARHPVPYRLAVRTWGQMNSDSFIALRSRCRGLTLTTIENRDGTSGRGPVRHDGASVVAATLGGTTGNPLTIGRFRVSSAMTMLAVAADDSTANLVVRAQKGEADAFEALLRTYLRAAYSIALAVVQRPADAEDVAQDAMLLAIERIGTCRDPTRFAAWLFQIVRNQSRNWLDRRRLRDVPAREDMPEQARDAPSPDAAAFRDRLVQALRLLSPVQREVILLHDLEGWTHPEIAAVLGTSELMCRQHLFHARQQLRDQLDGHSAHGGGS